MKAVARMFTVSTMVLAIIACQGADLRNIINSYNTPGFAMLFGGNGSDNATGVCELPNADFVAVGGSNSTDIPGASPHGDYDGFAARFDSTGHVLWQHLYGGSGLDVAAFIEPTLDGGFIVLGHSASADIAGTPYHGGAEDFWVLKLDANGIVLWQKLYGGNGDDNPEAISSTSDGGFLLAGSTTSTDLSGIASRGGSDGLLMKIDASGIIIWQKVYGGNGDDLFNSVQAADGDNFMLAGSSKSTDIVGSTNSGLQDFWVMKINSAGTPIWQKMCGGSGDDYVTEMQTIPSGGFFVAGVSYSNDFAGTVNAGNSDWLAMKLDANGEILWKKMYGGSGGEWSFPVHTVPDEALIMTGTSNSTDISGLTNHGLVDVLVAKIDGAGSVQWETMYGGSAGDWAHPYCSTLSGGYLVAGGSFSVDMPGLTSKGSNDFYILKLDSEGND